MYIMTLISIWLLPIFIVVGAFIVGLFIKEGGKMYSALRFVAAGYFIFVTIFGGAYDLFPLLSPVIFAILILSVLKCYGKYVLAAVWPIALCAALFSCFSSMYRGGIMLIMSFSVHIVYLGLLIAATVLRVKGVVAKEFIPYREKTKLLKAGNILSTVSFATFFIGIRNMIFFIFAKKAMSEDYIYEYYRLYSGETAAYLLIFAMVISFVCAFIAFFMLRNRRKECEDEFTAMDTALYIWSWVPVVISVVVVVAVIVTMFLIAGDTSSTSSGGATRTVTDENGKKQKLKYKGNTYEEVTDKNGDVWVTEDGGQHFRKRDTYIYKDPDGKEQCVRNPYGSTGSRPTTLEDGKGNRYETDGYGSFEKHKFENYDSDKPTEVMEGSKIRESEARKAEIIDENE